MKSLAIPARLYLILTCLVGAAITLSSLPQITVGDPIVLAVLCILGSALHILKVEGATNRSHYTFSFLVFGFAIVYLGPQAAVLVIIVSNLAEWIWNRPPWYIQLFNISCYAIVAELAGLTYRLANPSGVLVSWQAVLAILLSAVAFAFFNHLIVGIILWLARGENFKQSGIFDLLPLFIDLTMVILGASLVLVWTYNPYALLVFLSPLYPLYVSLRIPSLERKTEIDQKTGLYNHAYFMRQFTHELQRANRYDRPLCIIMADLDLLRNINNTYGHLAGDEVLKGVAAILKRCVRDYDIVARFGGEEFAVLMPEAELEKALERAEIIRSEIQSAVFQIPTSVEPIRATISLGISTRENFEQTAEEIVHHADAALYNSKLNGRNRATACQKDAFTPVPPAAAHAPVPASIDESRAGSVYAAASAAYVAVPTPPESHPQAGTVSQPAPAQQAAPPPTRPAPPKVLAFIIGMTIVAALLCLFTARLPSVLAAPVSGNYWLGLSVNLLLVVLTEWMSINLYVKNTSISTAAAPLLSAFILFGPLGVLLASLAFAVTASIKFRSPLNRLAFNLANHLIAGMLINLLLYLFSGLSSRLDDHVLQLASALLASLLLFTTSTSLISIGIGLDTAASPLPIWREQYRWMIPYYIGFGMIAFSIIFGFTHAGLLGIFITVMPLLLVRYSQVQYLEHTRKVVAELRQKNQALERSAAEINELNEGLLTTLSKIIDLRDPYVLGHSKYVSQYAARIARSLSLSPRQVELVRKAGLLHDIGKLGIAMEVLMKPGRLTREEYEAVKEHAALGGDLIKDVPSLRPLVSIIRHHHEYSDGRGYPDRLSGSQIPIEARIVAVADAIEAMSSDRLYRKALKPEQILQELTSNAGGQFDPLVVGAAVKILEGEYAAASRPAEGLEEPPVPGILLASDPQLI